MTSVVPTAFSASGKGLPAMLVDVGQHRLEAALHVEAVVAVADRLVERGQFLGMGDDRRATALDQLACRVCVASISWQLASRIALPTRLPAASK